MKKGLFSLLILLIIGMLSADFTESFDSWSDGSYSGISTYDGASGQWETNNAMCHNQNARSGNAVRFNDDSSSIVEYLLYKGLDGNGKDGGLGTISFWYRHWDGNVSSEPVEFIVEYQVGGTSGDWTAIGSSVNVTSTDYTEYSETVDLSGDDIFIRISNIQDKERLLIDDMTVTDYSSGSGSTLSAAFSADVTSGYAPLTVNFTDATTGGTPPYTYAWDFQNDSNDDSSIENPSFVFDTEGTYSVKLTVTDAASRTSDVELKTDYITVSTNPDYYAGITATSGAELKSQLHDLIDGHTTYSYTSLNPYLMETDKDPNNSSNCIEVYTGDSESAVSSKEHVWAKSHGEFDTIAPAGSDMHNLKPSQANVNSTRSNKDFDEGGSEVADAPNNYTDSDSWEPRDEVKGDIARIIFYMATRYEGDVPGAIGEPDLEIVNEVNTEDNDNGLTGYGEHGKLSTLLLWNAQDPVDAFEMNRNDVIQSYQGNRNPFIDHPEWVSAIWQNTFNVTIYDIQYVSNPSIDDVSAYVDQEVSTTGLVSGTLTGGYFLTTVTGGAWNGIYVDDAVNTPSIGDEVSITGTVEEYNGFTRITSVSSFSTDSVSNTLPSPTVVATNALDEQYEGVLVQVQNVNVTSTPDTYNQWDVTDGTGNCEVDDLLYATTPDPQIGDDYSSITGLVNYSYGVYDINPRSADDLVEPTTPNVNPIANAGTAYSATDLDLDGWADVTLDASASSDSDGSIVSYEWSWDDGQVGGEGATDLFFSEYVEGSSNNKYLEIFNGTGAPVNLETYEVRLYSNGADSASNTQTLSGTLADNDVYIISHASAALGVTANITSTVCYFNGDDTVALYHDGVLIDCIGQIGFDPGSSWGSSPTTTSNCTLVRKVTVTDGDTDGSDSFDPSVEWEGYDSDTATYLGSHTFGVKGAKVVQTASGVSVVRSFPLGVTTVTLTVTDNDGGTDTDTATVTVSESTTNQAPTITNIDHSPNNPYDSQNVEVTADVTDIDGTVSSVEIRWGLASGSLTNTVSMSLVTGDTYSGTIPAQSAQSKVYYAIAATDDDSDVTVSGESLYNIRSTANGHPRVIFSEVCDPADYNASYIELYNAGNAVQNLRGWSIVQYNSNQTTVLDDVSNTDIVTNMTGDYPLYPGQYVILIRGTLSDLLATYPDFDGYYFEDGTSSAGAPQINGGEYFELYDTQSKGVTDKLGDASNPINGDTVYERLDANSEGSSVSSDWAISETSGTPSSDNINLIDNDISILPVVFSYMLAEIVEDNAVGLTWKTETESEISHFEVYRGVTEEFANSTDLHCSIEAQNSVSGNLYHFVDSEVYLGIGYFYWIEAVDISGELNLYGPVYVMVGEDNPGDTPEPEVIITALKNIYPNPFNPSTSIEYTLKDDDFVNISVYDVRGRRVATLYNNYHSAGKETIVWNGTDDRGRSCSSGVYFFKMSTSNKTISKKAILMK